MDGSEIAMHGRVIIVEGREIAIDGNEIESYRRIIAVYASETTQDYVILMQPIA